MLDFRCQTVWIQIRPNVFVGPDLGPNCLQMLSADDKRGELRLSGNHTVTEYEMSGKPYSQKSGLKNHTNERIFQVMTRFDQFITR